MIIEMKSFEDDDFLDFGTGIAYVVKR